MTVDLRREPGRRRVTVLLVVATLLTLTGCGGGGDLPFAFEDRSAEAFGDSTVPTLADCYRTLRTQDSIARPDARSLDPVQPLSIRDGKIEGDTDNLPQHFSSTDLARCDNAVIAPMVAVGDLNQDGYDDLVKAPNLVLLNNGDATFRRIELDLPATGEVTLPGFTPIPTFERLPSTPVIVDLENDGRTEILLSYRGGLATQLFALFRQDPTKPEGTSWHQDREFELGTRLRNQVAPAVQALTTLDYDNDGYTDIVAGFFGGHSLTFNNERAGFATKGVMLLRNDQGRRLVDVTDETGIPDAIDAGVDLNVFQGSYSRHDIKRVPTHSVMTSDLDNDGFSDLVVAGDFGTGLILWNEGGKRFTLADGLDFTGHAHMGPALQDINGDGYLDIFSSQVHSRSVTRATCVGVRPCDDGEKLGNFWLVSHGPRQYTDEAAPAGLLDGGWGWGATFVDLDNDGDEELVQAAGLPQMLSPASPGWLHRNDPVRLWTLSAPADSSHPGGTWQEVENAAGLRIGVNTASVVSGDFDRDGRVDLVICSAETGRPYLFLNRGPSLGNWLEVTPVTEKDGRTVPVYGARVEVTYPVGTSTRTAVRYSGTQSQSYYSNSGPTSRFGVGAATSVRVTVRFPDGTVRTVDRQPVNQIAEIRR